MVAGADPRTDPPQRKPRNSPACPRLALDRRRRVKGWRGGLWAPFPAPPRRSGSGWPGAPAGRPYPEGGGKGLGQDTQGDVKVNVEVDGAGQGVGAERLDDLGKALFDGHPAGVVLYERFGLDGGVVGDDNGGGVAAAKDPRDTP